LPEEKPIRESQEMYAAELHELRALIGINTQRIEELQQQIGDLRVLLINLCLYFGLP